MQYISTRGHAKPLTFMGTVLAGLAEDGGLYMPSQWPIFSETELRALRGKTYQQVAVAVLRRYADDITNDALTDIIAQAYTPEKFGHRDIVPVTKLDDGLFLMGLSEGPTLAFKDMALQPLGGLMEYVLGPRGHLTILGATSGDTGSAAIHALLGRKNIEVFMLSPKDRMSPFQQAQMYTVVDPRIFNVVIRGTFDDCQNVVKAVNADAAFKKKHHIGAVNSINWARIAFQVAYYVYAFLQATDEHQKVSFAVPSGNFGNAFAAYAAFRMGVPIRKIIVATNENDVLDVFFKTGKYQPSEKALVTSSPSMDITVASNFERYVFSYFQQDAARVRDHWVRLATQGYFEIPRPTDGFPPFVSSNRTDAEVIDTIREVRLHFGKVLDPHTAVGFGVGEQYRDPGVPLIVAETAKWDKFEDVIAKALGKDAPRSKHADALMNKPPVTYELDPDPAQMKRFIEEHALVYA